MEYDNRSVKMRSVVPLKPALTVIRGGKEKTDNADKLDKVIELKDHEVEILPPKEALAELKRLEFVRIYKHQGIQETKSLATRFEDLAKPLAVTASIGAIGFFSYLTYASSHKLLFGLLASFGALKLFDLCMQKEEE